MIKIINLHKNYKDIKALKGISLHVKKGELFAYLGPNGSGKTTTIRILTGLTKASSGDAFINGFHVEKQGLQSKRQCGLAPQAINLDRELTVKENLYIHGRLFNMSKKEISNKTDELLEYIELTDRSDSIVKSLSGGMKRRVMIARALLHSPEVLFMDEPTVGLDPSIRKRIWELLKRIQAEGSTVFLTTHYIEEAEFLADRVAFIDEGKVTALDNPKKLKSSIGKWAVDEIIRGHITTSFYESGDAAKSYTNKRKGAFTIRRVNLEDAFISIVGKKAITNDSVIKDDCDDINGQSEQSRHGGTH